MKRRTRAHIREPKSFQYHDFYLFLDISLNLAERAHTPYESASNVPRVHLSELSIKALPLPEKSQKEYWDLSLRSFGVRVAKGGAKTFVLKRNNRREVLGRYPIVSLKQARDEAKRRLALKYFPSYGIHSTEAVRAYLEAKKGDLRPTTHLTYSIYLKALNKPVNEISPAYVYSILPKGKSAQNLAFNVYKAFLSWCVERDYITENPLLRRRQPNKLKSRERLLTDDEVRLIWKESYNHNHFGLIIRLLVLTAQRLSQVLHLQAAWIYNNHIQFPASSMKGAIEHTIPLLPAVENELSHIPFPRLPISACMIRFRRALPDIPHWTLHDFRRYLSSTMSRLNVPIDITETILAHKTGSRSPIQRVYDRDSRLPQMRDAFQLYHAHLQSIGCT